tara:strand:- start:876 stop:1928 length:1053 start_codon:yes stop_codon:yes gene_type:complete
MATLGTYCFDGVNFSSATSLYTDSSLSTLAADGYYGQGLIVRQQLNGILLNAQPCSACLVPCGTGLSASINNQNGVFDANIDLANDLGAVVIRCFMGQVVPDGIAATWNSVVYNRLTATDNHNGVILLNGADVQVDYAGIDNQGTGLPTYVGNKNTDLLSNSPYDSAGSCPTEGTSPSNYSLIGGTYVDQGTTQNVTIASDAIGYSSDSSTITSPVFTMVVPKTSVTPTVLNLKIFAPLCGTAFNWEVDCPVSLPSFTGSPLQGGVGCFTPNTIYYFVRNAIGSSVPYNVRTNTLPEIGNFVFTASDGSAYLNDTNTLQYIIIGNPGPSGTTALGIRNGVVVSSGPCNPT